MTSPPRPHTAPPRTRASSDATALSGRWRVVGGAWPTLRRHSPSNTSSPSSASPPPQPPTTPPPTTPPPPTLPSSSHPTSQAPSPPRPFSARRDSSFHPLDPPPRKRLSLFLRRRRPSRGAPALVLEEVVPLPPPPRSRSSLRRPHSHRFTTPSCNLRDSDQHHDPTALQTPTNLDQRPALQFRPDHEQRAVARDLHVENSKSTQPSCHVVVDQQRRQSQPPVLKTEDHPTSTDVTAMVTTPTSTTPTTATTSPRANAATMNNLLPRRRSLRVVPADLATATAQAGSANDGNDELIGEICLEDFADGDVDDWASIDLSVDTASVGVMSRRPSLKVESGGLRWIADERDFAALFADVGLDDLVDVVDEIPITREFAVPDDVLLKWRSAGEEHNRLCSLWPLVREAPDIRGLVPEFERRTQQRG